jgi:alpha-tubulin suppressor-like RCC1 family protein
VVASWEHTCGVTTGYKAYCWGSNLFNELGDGTNRRYVARPSGVVGGLSFRQVRPGGGHVCGVTTDQQIYCWGLNDFGQLGDGTRINRSGPVQVTGNHTWLSVTAGPHYTCGITTGSVTYCWGYNKQGQLGDSSSMRSKVKPSRVAGGHTFTQIDAGYDHTCAVTVTGQAYCWGNGAHGTLGNRKTYLSFWPRLVAGGHVFKQVTAGIYDDGSHSCGRTRSDRVYCWGFNSNGQLGDGTSTTRLTPVAVKGGIPMVQIWAGYLATCGVTAAGVAYCWGGNQYGQLGDGTTITPRRVPVRVVGPE